MAEHTSPIIEAMVGELGLQLPLEHLTIAAQTHDALHLKLKELRSIRLPYLDAIEPAHAKQWIKNRGSSRMSRERE
jgi:hypothetical protein